MLVDELVDGYDVILHVSKRQLLGSHLISNRARTQVSQLQIQHHKTLLPSRM